jgi:hypothetical protein
MSTRCPGHGRHWYSFTGMPGYRCPVCIRCGNPNPRPLSDAEMGEMIQLRADHQIGSWISVWPDARPAFQAAIDAWLARQETLRRKTRDILAEIGEQKA